MSNVLSDEKKQQIIALGRLGWSLRRIERATGVRRETAGAYLKSAGIGIRPRGKWGRGELPKPSNEVTTDSEVEEPGIETTHAPELSALSAKHATDEAAPPDSRSKRSISACAPYREVIEEGLNRGRNAMAIWQDLVTQDGFGASYQSVKRFVNKLRPCQGQKAHPVIVTAPGEEAQVDYGTGPMVLYPQTGKYRRTRLFVLTLGYSRKSVRFLVFHSSSQVWAELHQQAFRRVGGGVRILILDNLREGVLSPDIYDPALNPLYRDLLSHYGAVAMPCRVRQPDRKGKVESGVGHAQKTPLKGQRFESLEAAQAYLDHWEARWADTRIHGTTKRQVGAMFEVVSSIL